MYIKFWISARAPPAGLATPRGVAILSLTPCSQTPKVTATARGGTCARPRRTKWLRQHWCDNRRNHKKTNSHLCSGRQLPDQGTQHSVVDEERDPGTPDQQRISLGGHSLRVESTAPDFQLLERPDHACISRCCQFKVLRAESKSFVQRFTQAIRYGMLAINHACACVTYASRFFRLVLAFAWIHVPPCLLRLNQHKHAACQQLDDCRHCNALAELGGL